MGGLLRTKSWVSVPKMEKIKKKKNHVLVLKMEKLSKKRRKKKFKA